MILLTINTITVIFLSVVVFLLLMLLLVLMLILAKSKLIPAGEVKISVNNNEREIVTKAGSDLLTTLRNNNIFLPSACGGKGSCGMCKCQVLSGAGTILPIEKDFFTRKQQKENWRLACQIKVKQDLNLDIPKSILGIKKIECEVISNHNVASFIKELELKMPDGERLNFCSGEYIQIDVPEAEVDFNNFIIDEEYREEWEKYKMFDLKMVNYEPTFRAYSLANYPEENNILKLNVRIATPPINKMKGGFKNIKPGVCSSYIFSLKQGDKVKLSGTYGDFLLKDSDKEIVFIGGGAGMAPMRSHIFYLFKSLKTNRKVSFWYGARSKKEIFYYDEFKQIEKQFDNFSFHLALSEPKPEDNWNGETGFIHQVVYDNYLRNHNEPEEIEYYICGPSMMTQAVNSMLYNLGVPEENILYDDFKT
ncbi:MAG: NADH:ubiquinone reductase (Na(+)-transporting) subunit F [Bacteroidetes bacterium]|nr:MAG: NADH:ubiquinone reductase (Na(+)-transporting) subunit F [Bacteroidota bacterium]